RDGLLTGYPAKDFKSVLDLTSVVDAGGTTIFRNANGRFPQTEPGNVDGVFTWPVVGATDQIRYDFTENYLMANRISNLVTTKSDTFTVYIVIQGWREAGTAYPSLDWEKHIAYIADRSSGSGLTTTPVPAD